MKKILLVEKTAKNVVEKTAKNVVVVKTIMFRKEANNEKEL